jgi:hypothetical protein
MRVVHTSSGASGPGCWLQSQSGWVIAQQDIGQNCTIDISDGILNLPLQDGGTYANLSGPVSDPGTLVCIATPPPGNPNSWKVWAAPGAGPSQARALCRVLQREGLGTQMMRSDSKASATPSTTPIQTPVAYDEGVVAGTEASHAAVHAAGSNDRYCEASSPYAADSSNYTEWLAGCMVGLPSNTPKPAPE